MKITGLPLKLAAGGIIISILAFGYLATNKTNTPPEVSYCHPENADLAQDGRTFAALTPDRKSITVSRFEGEKQSTVINLSRPAHDIIFLGNQNLLLSYGASGEVSIMNIESEEPEQVIKIGKFAGDMCRTAVTQALISDSMSDLVYQFDLATKSVTQTHAIKGNPAHMKWNIPESELAVFDENGVFLGRVNPATTTPAGQ